MAPTRTITDSPTLPRGPRFRPRRPSGARAPGVPASIPSGRLLIAAGALLVGLGLGLEPAIDARWSDLAGAAVTLATFLAAGALGYLALTRRESSLRVRAVAETLEVARKSALATARATLSATDADTAHHCDDVAQLADALCEAFEIEGEERQRIWLAADLHDVGKIAVPREILNKPGPLNSEEWEVVEQHTLVGERILRSVPELDEAAGLVRHSHEHWDGSGYPDGLAGEEIPLGSRVILCADAFHAIRSDRPYRSGRSASEAVAELRANAGTQFDPAVVDALARLASRTRGGLGPMPLSRRTVALLVGGLLALLGTAYATDLLPLPKPVAGAPPAPREAMPTHDATRTPPHSSGGEAEGAKGAAARHGAQRGRGRARAAKERARSRSKPRLDPGSAGAGSAEAPGPDFPTPVRAHGDPAQAQGVARGRPSTVIPRGRGR
jgi:hypothetical protein